MTKTSQCGMCGESFEASCSNAKQFSAFCSKPCEEYWAECSDREWGEQQRTKEMHRVPDEGDCLALAGIGVDFTEELKALHTQFFKKDFCGRFSIRGTAHDGSHRRYSRVNCKCWNCARCAPKRAKLYRRSICRAIEKHKLCRMLTLTLDLSAAKLGTREQRALYKKHFRPKLQCGCDSCSNLRKKSVPYTRKCFNKLRTYWRRQFKKAPTFIAVLEFQKNGNPHLHVMVDRYMDFSWIQSAWQAVGGGQFVNIKQIDLHRAAHYISKYLSKEDYAMLFSAPIRSRRVTTSRSIQLLEKSVKEHKWELLRTVIQILFDMHEDVAEDVRRDEDGTLQGFSVLPST
jgi:hypothetical protein